jgi:hypothetical protein
MRKIKILVLAGLTLFACSCAQISVKKDEISNKSVMNMNITITANDYSLIGYIQMELIREADKNNYGPVQLKLTIHPVKRLQIFDDIINIKLDDKVYKLKMKSITSDILSTLTGSRDLSNLGIGFNDTRGFGLSPTVMLTKDIEKEMLKAKSIMFTITSGSEFALFKFSNNDIKNIQKFITFRVE